MFSTDGNSDFTKTGMQADADAAVDAEYPLNHMMSTPIESETTALREIDLEHDPDVLLYGH